MAKNTVAIIATGQAIGPGAGTVNKVVVNTHSSGVISLIDNPNGGVSGRVILADTTLVSGAQVLDINADYAEGVTVKLVSGSATLQLVYTPSVGV